ncbi:MAG TPA: HWE histidine kinase domain-containing protein [Gemmataceae bacterium]|nr:HWE histidine kinase domain-containing protein [Gemmataceae bacterium]
MLVQRPERVYSWLVEADVSLPECLLVPLSIGTDEPIGTIWIVSEGIGHFNEGHSHTLTDIAAIAGIALHIKRSEEHLRSALDEQKILAREMGHRLKNLFTMVHGMVPVAARRSSTTEELARRLLARLNALSEANALVRPALDVDAKEARAAELGDLISAVLRPYEHGSITLEGPPITLTQRGTNVVALILYELATNASKYGALSMDAGRLSVAWSSEGGLLTVNWVETGGPPVTAAPGNAGFGTSLVARTVGHYKGAATYHWRPTGLELTITLPEGSIVEQRDRYR